MNLLWRIAFRVAYRFLLIYWFLFRPRCDGAHVAVWCDDRILLVRDSYRRCYTLPSGTLKRGEDAAVAAARELEEEVGLEVRPDELERVFETVQQHEFKSDHSVVYEVEYPAEPATRVDQREIVWAGFVEASSAAGRPLSPIVREYLQWRSRDGGGARRGTRSI